MCIRDRVTSPTDKLDIAGAARFTSNISFSSSKAGRIYKASNHGLAIHGVAGSQNNFALFTPAGQLKIINPAGTEDVSLNPSSGNVGIGTGLGSSPGEKLTVTGNISSSGTGYYSNIDINPSTAGAALTLREPPIVGIAKAKPTQSAVKSRLCQFIP